MLLSDVDIRASITSGDLVVEPYDDELIQPASLDVRLDHRFRTWCPAEGYADPENDVPIDTRLSTVDKCQSFGLAPGEFALGATLEYIEVGRAIAVELTGKSSLGRLGVAVHMTAGWIDPGFKGQVTLELHNASSVPVLLRPGMAIAQLMVHRLSSPCARPYGSEGVGRYQGQRGPTPSRSRP